MFDDNKKTSLIKNSYERKNKSKNKRNIVKIPFFSFLMNHIRSYCLSYKKFKNKK